jgi:hypothetical protein
VAFLAPRPPLRQLCTDRSFQIGLSALTFCTCFRRSILSPWQAEWDKALGNRLRVVKPSLQETQSSFRAVRKDEVTLTRPRMGHTRRTHGHLLRGRPAPVCTHCGVPLIVALISVDCPRYTEARRTSYLDGVISDIRRSPLQ